MKSSECNSEVADDSVFCSLCGCEVSVKSGSKGLVEWAGHRVTRSLEPGRWARSFEVIRTMDRQRCFLKVAAPEFIRGIDPEWHLLRQETLGRATQQDGVAEDRSSVAFDWVYEQARGGGVRISETVSRVEQSTFRSGRPGGSLRLTPNEIIRRQAECCRCLSGRKGWSRFLGRGMSGREAPREWLAMEWVDGTDLRSWVARMLNSGNGFAEVLGVFRQIAEILRNMERDPGWIHGDLKAAHVRIVGGEVRLLDPPMGQRQGDGEAWAYTRVYNPFRLASDASALALMLWYALGGRLILRGEDGVWLDLCEGVKKTVSDLDGHAQLALHVTKFIGGEGIETGLSQEGLVRVLRPNPAKVCKGPDDFLAFLDGEAQLLEALWTGMKPIHGDRAWRDEMS